MQHQRVPRNIWLCCGGQSTFSTGTLPDTCGCAVEDALHAALAQASCSHTGCFSEKTLHAVQAGRSVSDFESEFDSESQLTQSLRLSQIPCMFSYWRGPLQSGATLYCLCCIASSSYVQQLDGQEPQRMAKQCCCCASVYTQQLNNSSTGCYTPSCLTFKVANSSLTQQHRAPSTVAPDLQATQQQQQVLYRIAPNLQAAACSLKGSKS